MEHYQNQITATDEKNIPATEIRIPIANRFSKEESKGRILLCLFSIPIRKGIRKMTRKVKKNLAAILIVVNFLQ